LAGVRCTYDTRPGPCYVDAVSPPQEGLPTYRPLREARRSPLPHLG